MFITDDPLLDFERYDREQYNRLRKRPVCIECGEPIQDDHYYQISDETICPDCMEGNYRREVEDYIE